MFDNKFDQHRSEVFSEIGKKWLLSFWNIFLNILTALCWVYIIILINVGPRINRGCFQHPPNKLIIIIIIARFSQSNHCSIATIKVRLQLLFIISWVCLRKQTAIRHAAAWKRLDLNPGPPDTKQPLYHLCYLANIFYSKNLILVIIAFSRAFKNGSFIDT